MASKRKFRVEHVEVTPAGWRVRTVKHPSGHSVRLAFPPGRRKTRSGRLVEILHPRAENPGRCAAGEKMKANPSELLIMGLGNPKLVTEEKAAAMRDKAIAFIERIGSDDPNDIAGMSIAEYVEHKGLTLSNPKGKSKVKSQKAKGKSKNAAKLPRKKNGYSEQVKMSDGKILFLNVDEVSNGWRAEGYPAIGKRRVGKPKVATGDTESRAIDNLVLKFEPNPKVRQNWFWSSARKQSGPLKAGEVVKIRLTRGRESERIWVSLTKVGKKQLEGKLVNEPVVALDAHYGDMVRFKRGQILDREKNPTRRNQEGGAVAQGKELYRAFHGKDPEEVRDLAIRTEVQKTYVYGGDLAAGRFLQDDGYEWTIKFHGDHVQLASSPKGTQLYAIGGNQDILQILRDRGIDTSKELISFGRWYCIYYDAAKSSTNFQMTEWEHYFGCVEEIKSLISESHDKGWSEAEFQARVKEAMDATPPLERDLPEALYDRLNQRILFAGGSYYVDWPGIVG